MYIRIRIQLHSDPLSSWRMKSMISVTTTKHKWNIKIPTFKQTHTHNICTCTKYTHTNKQINRHICMRDCTEWQSSLLYSHRFYEIRKRSYKYQRKMLRYTFSEWTDIHYKVEPHTDNTKKRIYINTNWKIPQEHSPRYWNLEFNCV